MSHSSIDGEKLYYAFTAGKESVIANKNYLNKINVFPVADGDTGTNLAITMDSIANGSCANTSASKVTQEMASAALMGSRGNSGIIFAQFIQGLSKGSKDKLELTKKDFAIAVKLGVESAYAAVNNPVEGTILTIMSTWADSLNSLHDKVNNFAEFIGHSIDSVKNALRETPKKLKVLEEAGVVDAGAQGFVHFIEGFLHFFRTGIKPNIIQRTSTDLTETNAHHFNKYQLLEFRYCSEGLIQLKNSSSDIIKNILLNYGDSLIVADSSEKIKFHIHTNKPTEMFFELCRHGNILHSKVEDMQRQNEVQFRKKSSIALVIDSACDIPQSLLDKHQIHLIPINLTVKENHFLDKLTITSDQFYSLIEEQDVVPSTSQPSIKTFENLYEYLLENYESVISIHLSQALSGTWNTAKVAANKFSNDKIAVINSKQISCSFGLMVQRIAEDIESGKSFRDIVQTAESLSDKTKILVSVKTLKYMIRSGRVSQAKGLIANLLNLKPIVSLDEKGASRLSGKSFGFMRNINNIVKEVALHNKKNKITKYAIGHTHNENDAKYMSDKLEQVFGKKPEFIIDIAPVIGVHAGIGAVCVSYIEE